MIIVRFLPLLAIALANYAFALQERQVIDLNVKVKKDLTDQEIIDNRAKERGRQYLVNERPFYEGINEDNRKSIMEFARPNYPQKDDILLKLKR
ncbi:MAG: hypothetical protein K0R73_166 [Candidatus Midichloriaceae bacterium]|jgi:hypothetical protein|nr:hypothetical protein [Candidatus Midichloriaceae bacterium]